MQITATINEHGAAILKCKTVSGGSTINVPDADGLADDIEATLIRGRQDSFRDTYAVLIESTGCVVMVDNAKFPVPWQDITAVVAQLQT